MSQLTIQQAFDRAVRHHQSGQLSQAEELYRQILVRQPDHAEALHRLGLIAYQGGRIDSAVDLIRRAIGLQPTLLHAHYNLGVALHDTGRHDEAIAAFHQATALTPNLPEAHYNLGLALSAKGQLDEAIAACRRAVALRPHYPEAYNVLGNALKDVGQLDAAIAAYRQALTFNPLFAPAHNNLGNALREQGQFDAAIAACRRAIALQPQYPEAYCNLGNALKDKGQLDEALAAFRQAIALNARFPEAYNNLGNLLKEGGRLDAAIAAHRQAIALNPLYAHAHSNLGNALREQGQLDAALAACRQALALQPGLAEAHANLAITLKDQGQMDEALAAYRQAVALAPGCAWIHSNLVLTLHFHAASDAPALAEEHDRWNRQHAAPLKRFIQPHSHDRSPARRLRIGYVSPDLRDHPVGRFLLPLLAHHDRSQFEVLAYAQVPVPDAVTERLRASVDGWRKLVGLTDAQAADLIRRDGIDILVDLALHTAHHRLQVFARKPAPVQVTYLAYCSSSGLDTIDYRLSDPYIDPPGMDESVYSEQTIRLPDSFWCYDPLEGREIPVPALPALAKGSVTFGCLNNFCKASVPALTTWARLLDAVPQSQLLLHAPEGAHRQRTADMFQRLGVDPQRLRFAGHRPWAEYLQLYHQIDMALDPFPYGGGMTTCDALWMGVPVVSLAGGTAVGRGGLSILSNIGLPDWVASNPEQYVQRAAAFAHDLPRLAALRSSLRQRLAQSPLMDAPRFARNIEAAYRAMWRTWCMSALAAP